MHTERPSQPLAAADPSWRVGIVYSSFYTEEVESMVRAARETLQKAGMSPVRITEHPTAGSFEVPLIGKALADARSVDALIGLGIIVEGETHHADLLAQSAARGVMDVQVASGIPFAFDILYVDTLEQARARATGPHNKGEEAAYAVLHSLAELKRIRSEKN